MQPLMELRPSPQEIPPVFYSYTQASVRVLSQTGAYLNPGCTLGKTGAVLEANGAWAPNPRDCDFMA